MKTLICNSVTEAWDSWYSELALQDKDDNSRDGAVCGEILNAITVIKDPTYNIVQSDIRKMPIKYAIGELLWYLSGTNKLDAIKRYSKAWEALSDNGETVNSAYGYRIFEKFGFNQWDYVRELLRKDPNSRQAVIHIKDADNTPTKDLPCTVCLQFLLRDGKLNLTTYMRSNDIWLGFPYDVFSFTCLQIIMAFELGVEIGEYTHIAGSLHLYSRNKQ
jgi:thymidylate synthase